MPTNIEFEVDESIGTWSYGDRSFASGEPHKVSASKELAGAVAAAASAGVLHLSGSEDLVADHVEDDEISVEVQESLSDDQLEEREAVFKLLAEHDFNCNSAAAAFNAGSISESVLDALQTESAERLTAAVAQVSEDSELRAKLAGSTPRTLTPAIDAARELMGREPIAAALAEEGES